MNYIVTEQDERLQILVSIVKRMKQACNVVVFSEVQVQFLNELFTLLGLVSQVSTQANEQGLQIYYDPPIGEIKKGLVFVMPEEKITFGTETKLEKTKQAQFVNEDVQKLVSRNYNLNCLAEKAYKDFVYVLFNITKNYQHKLSSTYDVLSLNPMRLCKSFGFEVTPRLNNFRLKPSIEYAEKKKPATKKAIKKTKKSIQKLKQ